MQSELEYNLVALFDFLEVKSAPLQDMAIFSKQNLYFKAQRL